MLAAVLAFAGSAAALPTVSCAPDRNSRADGDSLQSGDAGLILVQNRSRGGGGAQRQQRAAGTASRGNFQSNDFHRNAVNAGGNRSATASANRSANVNTSRNTNVTSNRNVNVNGNGDCCNGNYDDGPSWGGVAAGVAVGAMVGAAASQPAYPPPPPTYPPGYVAPPPY